MGACGKLCTRAAGPASVLGFNAMRTTVAIFLSIHLLACSKGANEGAEEAKKQAEKEQKEKEASGGVAKKISPPVAGKAKLSCANVINAELFTQVLGEPVTVADSKS